MFDFQMLDIKINKHIYCDWFEDSNFTYSLYFYQQIKEYFRGMQILRI